MNVPEGWTLNLELDTEIEHEEVFKYDGREYVCTGSTFNVSTDKWEVSALGLKDWQRRDNRNGLVAFGMLGIVALIPFILILTFH